MLRDHCPITRAAGRVRGERKPAGLLRGSPFATQVGLKLVFADSGKAAVTLPVTAGALSGEGTVHRGAITALVEAAAGATLPEAEEQEAAALSDIKISFVRPAPQHPLVAEARTLACHGSLRSCEVDVHDWNGELVAKGFLTYSDVTGENGVPS